MARVPLQTGCSLMQWQQGLHVNLEKSPGNYDVKWLHIILLFEADCNANNKWLGREFMLTKELPMLWLVNNTGVRNLRMQAHNVLTKDYGMIMFGYRKNGSIVFQQCKKLL